MASSSRSEFGCSASTSICTRESSCFPAKASVETVIDTLVEGKTIDRFVTIPEGKTSEEVVADLESR